MVLEIHSLTFYGIPLNPVSQYIDSSTANFQDRVLAAVNQHVPKMKLRRKPRPPWIDKEVLTLEQTFAGLHQSM